MDPFEDFREFSIDLDGITIAGRMGGSGPPVLLLHGYPQNHWEWARVAPLLARDHTVVCADLRGYGQSSKPPADGDAYSFRSMANDQVGLMTRLGFDRFHLVGHDRGARTAHRLALDHPASVLSLCLLDIVPTLDVFEHVDAKLARTNWHWFFLQLPSPFPETLIRSDPEHFYESSLFAFGATPASAFDPRQLAAYRRAWHDEGFARGTCGDYRAAATLDVALDRQDLHRQVDCPALVLWGSQGALPPFFDIEALWRRRLSNPAFASLPSGHFFVDFMPDETAGAIGSFLRSQPRTGTSAQA